MNLSGSGFSTRASMFLLKNSFLMKECLKMSQVAILSDLASGLLVNKSFFCEYYIEDKALYAINCFSSFTMQQTEILL